MWECNLCSESFPTTRSRSRHKKRTHAHLECICRRKFVLEIDLSNHRKAMRLNAEAYKCPYCCLSFYTEASRQNHLKKFVHGSSLVYVETENKDQTQTKKKKRCKRREKGNGTGEHACPSCSRTFCKQSSLLQHQQVKGHVLQSSNTRKTFFDGFYAKQVTVDKEDAVASRVIVDSTMNKLLSHVREYPGGDIFNPNVIKAGSVPVNTKIGKADEFDTNIVLNVKPTEIRQQGKVNYEFTHNGNTASGTSSMKVQSELKQPAKSKTIPSGFATVKVERDSVPENLLHGDDIIPRKVKQDLFSRMADAKHDLSLTNVDISRKSHGPALTMTIHPTKESGVKHDINVDMTASVMSNVSITEHGWPRPSTKQAFSEKVIDKVIETGTHLVPKKDEFWSVSNSKAERTLFSSIDEGNGCRKMVYKTMKKHVQTSKSQSSDGLPGISSHILKTQILWSSEKHPVQEYWHQNNRDVCLIETMKEMEASLRQGKLPDYFNPSLNVLEGKDGGQLSSLAEHLEHERILFERK